MTDGRGPPTTTTVTDVVVVVADQEIVDISLTRQTHDITVTANVQKSMSLHWCRDLLPDESAGLDTTINYVAVFNSIVILSLVSLHTSYKRQSGTVSSPKDEAKMLTLHVDADTNRQKYLLKPLICNRLSLKQIYIFCSSTFWNYSAYSVKCTA